MIIDFDVSNHIKFEINVSLYKLLSIMREAKVYFHPMRGESFGMSVVEAMATGLVPIVPDVGGPTEFVSHEYHFNTLEQAAQIISCALHLPHEERIQISSSVHKFSIFNYITGFQHVVNGLLSH